MKDYYVIYKLFEGGTVSIVSASDPQAAAIAANVPANNVASVFPVDGCTEVRVSKTAEILKKE